MIKSMTGYGKAECTIGSDKYLVEIRSVNGKSADITIKTSLIPREHEVEVRQMIAAELGRGNIDLFITLKRGEESQTAAKAVNAVLFKEYCAQLRDVAESSGMRLGDDVLFPAVLRMPDVLSQQEKEEMSDADWKTLYDTICEAVAHLNEFRAKEGESLRLDVFSQVDKIETYVPEVEKYERERIDTIRERIVSHINELSLKPDADRLEQEMIFYIEKLDINEEKVRLRQHCKYFRETAENEPMPGKKLGFIAQEMGREINTMGSKSNHAEMQKWVVRMKDELEKIKEQSLNIL